MTWVRLDDEWPDGSKARAAGRDGRSLYVVGLCHCAKNETDGFIAAHDLPLLLAKAEVTSAAVKKLTASAAGQNNPLWHTVPGGYEVHDFLVYNPSRAQLDADREAGARRQKASRSRRGNDTSHAVTDPATNAVTDTVSHACASTDPIPYPLSKSSSSRTSLGPKPPDDGEPLEQACRILAGREADGHADIRNRPAWVRARTKVLVNTHADTASGVLASHPDVTAGQLVAYLDGSRPTVPDPLDEARRRGTSLATLSLQDALDAGEMYPEGSPQHTAYLDAWRAAHEATP